MFAHPLDDTARLRPLEPWQAGEFAAHVDRVRPHLEPWLGWAGRIRGEADARAFLQQYATAAATDGGRVYGIWDEDVLVGGALFRLFDVKQGVCELSVWLSPEAGGRGLITGAVRHMIDWAVDVRGIARIEWRCEPANERSAAVARRLGFTSEGVNRSAYALGDRRVDIEVWAVLAEEWRAGRTEK